MKKLTIVLTIFFLTLSSNVLAQNNGGDVSSPIETSESGLPILDLRCERERILNPNSRYVVGENPEDSFDDCKTSNNTEEELVCRDILYSGEEDMLFGPNGLNIFGTDIVFNQDTLPGISRAIFSLIFALFGLRAGWEALRGLNKWLGKINSGEDTAEAVKIFSSGLWGIFYSAAGIFIVALIFWLLGYGVNIFDIEPVVDKSLDTSCEGFSEAECRQYNLSCVYNDIQTENFDLVGCVKLEQPLEPNCG